MSDALSVDRTDELGPNPNSADDAEDSQEETPGNERPPQIELGPRAHVPLTREYEHAVGERIVDAHVPRLAHELALRLDIRVVEELALEEEQTRAGVVEA